MQKTGMSALACKLSEFPRMGLARLPTPLEPLHRLTEYLNGPRLWAKREDLIGVGFGGNKVRKLDFVLAEAIAADADTLVSGGVEQSNSQRQIAACAARLGLHCHLAVYHGRLEQSDEEYSESGNALLNKFYGAHFHHFQWTGHRNDHIREVAHALDMKGHTTYVVPYGVSSPLGAIGYSSVIVELVEQSTAMGFCPSAIVHASGSAGTQAGLVVGTSMCLDRTRVLGIDIDAEPDRVKQDVMSLAESTCDMLEVPFFRERVEVLAGHAGSAYGMPDSATLEAMRLLGRLEALILDPVYTGKCMAGLISLIREGCWGKNEDVIFIHTGGTPALFAYRKWLMLQD